MARAAAEDAAFIRALGKVIRDRRKSNGMSLNECAKLVGWSDSVQSRAELGRRALSVVGLRRLCWALSLEPAVTLKLAQDEAFPSGLTEHVDKTRIASP